MIYKERSVILFFGLISEYTDEHTREFPSDKSVIKDYTSITYPTLFVLMIIIIFSFIVKCIFTFICLCNVIISIRCIIKYCYTERDSYFPKTTITPPEAHDSLIKNSQGMVDMFRKDILEYGMAMMLFLTSVIVTAWCILVIYTAMGEYDKIESSYDNLLDNFSSSISVIRTSIKVFPLFFVIQLLFLGMTISMFIYFPYNKNINMLLSVGLIRCLVFLFIICILVEIAILYWIKSLEKILVSMEQKESLTP